MANIGRTDCSLSTAAYLSDMMWKPLQSFEDLDTAIAASHAHPVVLFKHSTRCSVSAMAKRNFEAQWDPAQQAEAYLLDLITYRSVSNAIAERFEVQHESPQMLVISDARLQFHESHGFISAIHPSISGA